jgi:hypothetical protein
VENPPPNYRGLKVKEDNSMVKALVAKSTAGSIYCKLIAAIYYS